MKKIVFSLVLISFLSACGSPQVYKDVFNAESFTAARYFEDGKDSIVLTVNANVIASGSDKATIYINAVQHVEKVRTKTERFLLIPIGSEAQRLSRKKGL